MALEVSPGDHVLDLCAAPGRCFFLYLLMFISLKYKQVLTVFTIIKIPFIQWRFCCVNDSLVVLLISKFQGSLMRVKKCGF